MLNSELEILSFWRENQIFEKSIHNRKNKEPFVFFDGPPFATGLPHWGHILISQLKDTVLRYNTQKGYYIPRRWGWDCHGAPIEVLAEKDLGIYDKRQIENEIGIEKFNDTCRSLVMTYDNQWRSVIERIGRWVDMDDQYRTMDTEFIESVWWGLGQLWNKGLLYKDYRISMYSPSIGVPLTHTDVAMEVVYENETIETPVVRFKTVKESGDKLIKKVLESVETNINEQMRYKDDMEKRVHTLTNPSVKRASKNELLDAPTNVFDAINWDKFRSSEEINQELQSIKPQMDTVIDNLNTLTKISKVLKGNYPVNILAWTTTPWTLPANVALAINPEIEYSLFYVSATNEVVILADSKAKDVLSACIHPAVIESKKEELKYAEDSSEYFSIIGNEVFKLATISGKDLEGLEYHSLFKITQNIDSQEEKNNAFKVYAAEFVTAVDGTGVVHIAPAYGEDDFNLGKERNLPIIPSLNDHGEIKSDLAEELSSAFGKKFISSNPIIVDILDKHSLLFDKFKYKHRVPIYGRDNKKVYYKAQEGWFIAETKLSEKSVQLNGDINWQPKQLRQRFENGLESAPNWCISRNRYWGNPIPIWQTEDQSRTIFVDSITKLEQYTINPIYKIINTRNLKPELYQKGKTIILTDSQAKLPLGINATQYRSKNLSELRKTRNLTIASFSIVAQKILDEVMDLFNKYDNVQIFFKETEQVLWTTWLLSLHVDSKKNVDEFYFYRNVEKGITEYEPVGPVKQLDLHRPHIDDILLQDNDDNVYTRITEVLDCWVESGSMPHASVHYPFTSKNQELKTADWIVEGQDQTRGWFRALHVLSNGIFNKAAYKNINCTGLVMAKDGQKMSKSKKNYTDPEQAIEKYGADAVRLYTLSSPVVNAENLNFSEKDLQTVFRENTLLLSNSIKYINYIFAQYPRTGATSYKHPLNRWWKIYTNDFVNKFQEHMDKYEIQQAARLVTPYIDNMSTWYIRRTKDLSEEWGTEIADCLQDTISMFAKASACIQPFNSEKIWSNIRTVEDLESIHLTDLPAKSKITEKQESILATMDQLRDLVSKIHSIRKSKNLRIRQPLYADFSGINLDSNWNSIIQKECNLLEKNLSKVDGETFESETEFGKIKIDLVVDDELAVLGYTRDLERLVQAHRKNKGYKPGDHIVMTWKLNDTENQEMFGKVIESLDWGKLNIEVRWVNELEESDHIKELQIKGLASILVQ